jgi:hypothetical protein
MSKFSIVIPTLWRSVRIHSLLQNLISSPNVDEVIIIDNSRRYNEFYKEVLPKVKVLSPLFNIYVNPAWNYGVQYSKNNSIALVNDDISFDPIIFEEFEEFELKSKGFIGMSSKNYTTEKYNPKIVPWKGEVVLDGWGCIVMFHKDNWIPIPDGIKIWYGDNYMREINPAPSHILEGLPIKTEMSTTSKESTWNHVKDDDARYWISNFKIIAHERIKNTINSSNVDFCV